MERSPCLEKSEIKKRGWSVEEDRLLITHVQKHGHGCWQSVPKAAGLRRSGKSCRLRWINYLRPDVKLGNFTEEEERIIVALYNAIGSRWSIMATQLPGRTDNSIRNYWNTHLRSKVSTRSLFPLPESTEKDENVLSNSLFPLPESTDKDENVLSNKGKFRVNDTFWEQFLAETARDTGVAESEDFPKLFKRYGWEPSKSSTEFNVQNEVDAYIASYIPGLPRRPEDLQNELNMIFQVDSSSDPPMDTEDALQNVNIALGVDQSNGKRSDSSTQKKRVIKTHSQREYITTKLSFSPEVLRQHFGMTIDDAADSLGRMEDLREKVAKRLGLEVGSFKLKHKDDAGDLVLITCDDDLQDCVDSSSRSLDKATIAMLVLPLTNLSG